MKLLLQVLGCGFWTGEACAFTVDSLCFESRRSTFIFLSSSRNLRSRMARSVGTASPSLCNILSISPRPLV
ncbi:hypothetical protein B0T24DRAFT_618792 [Lasiosphaeria ovina]|uniref:Secreted protein n=1 Tax=Lasiosphaeria ovina TaxID=92902 RepID=A0AAE0NAU9_9PEZI|nr:hypothetical protein B0T24DRAFT_618792 [Lasiosphaeria ovina]